MKPITTEASNKQTDGETWRNRHDSSIAFANRGTLKKKTLPSAKFFLAFSNYNLCIITPGYDLTQVLYKKSIILQ